MLRTLLLLCVGIALSSARLNAQELIQWHDDLEQARQTSQQYKVPILIHFYGDNCMPCKALEKNVFTRPEVASTMQRYFVPVHINATYDRRTAAQYGVHSWPTDIFVAPDGKILTQGVCNQNPAAYLQNLQNVAVMNRDRNIMLAGNPQPAPANAQPAGAAAAAPTANPYAAPQASNFPAAQPTGAPASNAAPAAPYGRLATTSLQQEAPGRDQAPAPYTNPSSGPSPYAAAATAAPGLAAAAGSALPSPTWNGQSAHGQAAGGLVGAGPLANSPNMTVPPATPGTSQAHKDANLPQSAQWQPGTQHAPSTAPAAPTTLGNGLTASAAAAMSPALANSPTLPASAHPAAATPSGPFNPPASQSTRPNPGAVVENPHFAQPSGQRDDSAAKGPSALTVAARGPLEKVTSVAEPKEPASVPAMSGYCPVALLSTSQWIEGKPEHAVRHRGRVYFLSSAEAAQQFLTAPDNYCPVLSGYDPLVLLRDGALVEGSVYTGLRDATQNRILLFSSAENKQYFQDNYDRLATELDNLLKPAEARTAAAPTQSLSR